MKQQYSRQKPPDENHPVAMSGPENLAVLVRKLEQARIEVFPSGKIVDRLQNLAAGSIVPVSCSPKQGIETTLEICADLLVQGLQPVPHIAARLVRDRGHLERVLRALTEQNHREIFVVGGDSKEPEGPFDSACSLLAAIADSGVEFERVGITAYPEGHPLIDDAALLQALHDKQLFATYMVTQMCFSIEAIVNWLAEVRAGGINLPVYVGLPGASNMQKLMRFALQIGVGQSMRFLKKYAGLIGQAIGPAYDPTRLIADLAPYLADSAYGIEGFHIFTFNQIEETEAWRQRLTASPQQAMEHIFSA